MNEEHLKILRQGVKAWNTWREEHPEIQPDLRGAPLQYLILQGANLEGACLQAAKLRGANLQEANLQGTNLEGTNLEGADLQRAYLHGACLREAILKNANLQNASLEGADLQRAYFHGARLQEANLRHANLQSANLEEADLQRANLQGAYLHAYLQGADLQGAQLQEADFQGAHFDSARLDGAHLGSPERAMKIDLLSAQWKRVRVDVEPDLEWKHDSKDASYWVIRQGTETLHEALYRRLAEQAVSDITIEFSQAIWRELHLVEMGLREALGEGRFTVHKADDRLAVTFRSPEDLQRGLEAVVVQLAALEAVEPNRVKSMTVRPPEGEVIVLEPADMDLGSLAARMERLEEMLDRRLPPESDLVDESVENLIDKLPGLNLFTPALAWLFRHGREHFELIRRRREQSAIAGDRPLLTAGEDSGAESAN